MLFYFFEKKEFINLWTSKPNLKAIYKGNSLLILFKIKVNLKIIFFHNFNGLLKECNEKI